MRSEFEYQALNEDGKLSLICGNTRWNRPKRPIPIASTVIFSGVVAPISLPSFMISFHRVDDESDLEAYLSRLEQIDRVLGDLLDLSKEQAAAGIRQPRFNYEFALEEISRVTTGVPFNSDDSSPNSPIWTDFRAR